MGKSAARDPGWRIPLLDTIDGSFMNFAYGWAFAQPVRKVYYNLAIRGCRSPSPSWWARS
jgi:hypothetical protein